MRGRRSARSWGLLGLLVFGMAVCLAAPLRAAPRVVDNQRVSLAPSSLQAAFAAAAHEFSVPESILLAVAYNVSRWEHHGGAPSTWGGYGVMHLRQLDVAPMLDGRGGDVARTP